MAKNKVFQQEGPFLYFDVLTQCPVVVEDGREVCPEAGGGRPQLAGPPRHQHDLPQGPVNLIPFRRSSNFDYIWGGMVPKGSTFTLHAKTVQQGKPQKKFLARRLRGGRG